MLLRPLCRPDCRADPDHARTHAAPQRTGPLGIRSELWYDFGQQAGDSNLFKQVVAHIAAAAVPHSVLQYLRSGHVTPLAKPTGGHRPLLMMSFLRRLTLKSVMAAKKESVALDLMAAFQNVSRRAILHNIEQNDPDFAAVFSRWYTGSRAQEASRVLPRQNHRHQWS